MAPTHTPGALLTWLLLLLATLWAAAPAWLLVAVVAKTAPSCVMGAAVGAAGSMLGWLLLLVAAT